MLLLSARSGQWVMGFGDWVLLVAIIVFAVWFFWPNKANNTNKSANTAKKPALEKKSSSTSTSKKPSTSSKAKSSASSAKSSNSGGTPAFPHSPKTSTPSKAKSSASSAKSVAAFADSKPEEIYKIAHALSSIAAIAGDSHLYVGLQDEDPNKGWPRDMFITATIDNRIISRKEWIPSDVIQYLESVPFTVSKRSSDYHLEYKFKVFPTYPSSLKYGVIDEMEQGASKSPFIRHGTTQFHITDGGGLITFDVD